MSVDLDALDQKITRPFIAESPIGELLAALISELRAARQFREDIVSALAPGRWRGFDGPDGVSKDEVIDDVAAALKRYEP
jgi:hypothetical protein